MKDFTDDLIDTLIRPPKVIFAGFDWTRTDKLKPTGEADRHRVLAAMLQPATELRSA